jgi:hypothetical protein
MSSGVTYLPPSENVAIFDVNLFKAGDFALTYNTAAKNFLAYPQAQGNEALLTAQVAGDLTCYSNLVLTQNPTQPSALPTYLQFPDGTKQYSAPTSNTPVANYSIRNLVSTSGIPTPYPTLTISSLDNFANVNYYDGIQFRLTVNYTTAYSAAQPPLVNGQIPSSGGVTVSNNTLYSPCFWVYPKAFQNCSATNVFCLTNAIGSNNTANTQYSPVTPAMSTYVTNGRPFYANAIVNEGNCGGIMYVTTSSLPAAGVGATGQNANLIFNFPAINFGSTVNCNWTIRLEVLNNGIFTTANGFTISTSGFTTNF